MKNLMNEIRQMIKEEVTKIGSEDDREKTVSGKAPEQTRADTAGRPAIASNAKTVAQKVPPLPQEKPQQKPKKDIRPRI